MFYRIGLAELFHIFRLHSKSITPFILKANNGWDAKKATKGLFKNNFINGRSQLAVPSFCLKGPD
jgi:hypothetical protein